MSLPIFKDDLHADFFMNSFPFDDFKTTLFRVLPDPMMPSSSRSAADSKRLARSNLKQNVLNIPLEQLYAKLLLKYPEGTLGADKEFLGN